MTINTTPAPISGPAAAGPPGPQGLWPEGEWAAGTKIKNTVLSHNNRVWVANKTTTQEPSDSASDWDLWIDAQGAELAGAYAEAADVASVAAATAKSAAEAARDSAIAAERRMRTQSLGTFANDAAAVAWAAAQTPPLTIVTGTSYLNSTTDVFRYAVVSAGPTITWHDVTEDEAAQAALATASASAAAASLQDFLNRYVGAFSSAPTYVGGSPPWVNGALYWNTLAGKFKVWTGATWVDSDATAQQAATDATGARDAIYGFWCGAAAADPTTKIGGGALTTACIYFNTVSGKLRTYATGAWRDYDKDAQDAAALASTKASDANTAKLASESARDAAAGSATAAGNSKAAVDASLLQAISYASLAQAGAASVSAQMGLSNLAAAQRAWKLTTAGVAICAYDVAMDDFGGNDWPRKANASYQAEALNTATRGALANFPTQAFILGETTVLSAFVGIDNTGPLWKSWTVAGLTCVFARNGSIWYGGTGGLYRIDLISDEVYKRDAAGLYKADQNVASYNQGTAVWTLVSSAGAIASATVNSVTAMTANHSPPLAARCNLPNPTVFAFTAGGVSTIRWDGVVCNSTNTNAFSSGCVDSFGNVWMINSSNATLYVAARSSVLSASWAINSLGSFTAAQIGIGTMAKVTACGPGMVAVAGSTGLARIKLDPTNPANSLINVKKTTVDTGWQVLGKTAFALAESSGALGAYAGGATITDQSASASNFTVVGGLNRAVVATGADTAGLTGWGVGNYATGAAIALGTADFEFPVSIVGASITGTQTYLSHGYYTGGAYSGARVLLQSTTSTLTATFHDGTNSASISVASALAAGGNYDLRLIYRSALTRFELWSNNVMIGTAARGSVGSLTHASANLFIGIDPALANPTVSTVILALIRAWTYATTPDQIAFMRADEKGRFNTNAQSLLTGANVQGAAYDPDTDTYGAPNSTGGCDVFKGSVSVANDNSATGSTNKLAAVSDNLGGGGWSLNGVNVSGASGVVESASLSSHFLTAPTVTGSQTITATVAKGARGYAAIGRTNDGGYWDVGLFNLSTGAFVAGYNYGGVQAGTFSVVADGAGWRISAAYSDGNPLSLWPVVIIHNAATDPVNSANLYVGDAVTIGAYVSKFMVNAGVTPATYAPSLSGSANAKAVAMAQGKVAVITAAGVDVWIPSADGLRAINDAVGSSKRPFYDPTFALSGPFKTTNTTPLNLYFGAPIREGESVSFETTFTAIQRDTQVASAEFSVKGQAVWPIGGTYRVDAATPTVEHRTNAGIALATPTADTTNKLPYAAATGLAATDLIWTIKTRWFSNLLQTAA